MIAGTNKIREAFEQGIELDAIAETWEQPLIEFTQLRESFFIY